MKIINSKPIIVFSTYLFFVLFNDFLSIYASLQNHYYFCSCLNLATSLEGNTMKA